MVSEEEILHLVKEKTVMYVIKKDGTREEFNVDKIIAAVNKSAARILYGFPTKKLSIYALLPGNVRSPCTKKKFQFRKCTIS